MNRANGEKWPWLDRTLQATRWSVVARMRRQPGNDPGKAAAEFCRCYWYPLYSFLRRSGYAESDAQDHVQSFLERLLVADGLATADAEKGRLRNFLITLLTRHVSSRKRHDRAQKRGGGTPKIPFEWAAAEASYQQYGLTTVTPEDAYRQALAVELVAEGVAALRRHYSATAQEALCEELLPALEGALHDETFEDVAKRLGMRAGAVRIGAVRMRERFRLAVKESAAGLLGIPKGPQLDAELRDIFCSPARPTGL